VCCCADADIEAILTKGERDTRDLNDKMNKFTENAKQFTMDGGLSLYDFKDEVRTRRRRSVTSSVDQQ
jgi:phosphoribosylaminoimidazole-succinocarboxamide synthase